MRMRLWMPRRLLFEAGALDYPMGRSIYERFRDQVETEVIKSHNRLTGLPGETPRERYAEAKRTLVIGVRKSRAFETSKPSADYAIPLLTGCPGHCEYCYLQTTLGPRPAVRVYVNVEEIFGQALAYMEERAPALTTFEGACTSDPLAVEHITGSMRAAVEFFGRQPLGRFRFVSKYGWVESLLGAVHGGRTRVRFSVNTAEVIRRWELGTSPLAERLEAAARLAQDDYPIGFIVGPIFLEGDWQSAYTEMLDEMKEALRVPEGHDMTMELITHRFTPKAKALILERFPESDLPMEESERRWKYGQFGYGKYLYPADPMRQAEAFFEQEIAERFPAAQVPYFV